MTEVEAETLEGKSSEEIVEICSEKLKSIYSEAYPLREKLHELDTKLIFWWKLKRQEMFKTITVKKVSYEVSGKKKRLKSVDLSTLLNSLSDKQRDELLEQLNSLR